MKHPHYPIIPPFILQTLAAGPDTPLASRARATLDHDASLRAERTPGALPSGRRLPETARDDGRTPNRQVHDAKNLTQLPGTLVRGEGDPATDDLAVTQAYDGLGHTWQLFMEHLGRDSLDGRGLGLVATVHYGSRYVNAFWNGDQMVFGDGDGEVFGSFTASLDVIAHELTHGLTQFTSGLNYAGQSGALNEHVSDVFGSVVKQFSLNQTAEQADWLIGAELLLPGVKGTALRSMAAPGTAYDDPRIGTDPQPGHMRDYVNTTNDYGGVHINSGIPNKAFHLVATTLGGPSWLAPAQIWYDTITGDIKADCDFSTFAELTLAAARDRYGADSAEARAVEAAWAGVGVTQAASPAPGSPSDTDPGTDGGRDSDRPDTSPLVHIRRTGGLAGLTRENSVPLGHLPPADAEAWRSLLATNTLQGFTEAPPQPDAFCYGVRCTEGDVDVAIPEQALPDHVRALLERTLRA